MVTESEKRLRCPDCGRPAEAMVRFPEPVTSNDGVLPAPQMVKRASCRNGHRWYPHEHPYADVHLSGAAPGQ